MTTSHLVARLDTALDGKVDLDHLQHARRQVITGGDFGLLLFVTAIELVTLRLQALKRILQLLVGIVVLYSNIEPLFAV